jgi:alkanesulfonate monooxygenase SsuD/methylene tetrahydromethanopterin reductase-like flavin-dependent oxidoreductase (luciferase family)
MVRYAVGLPNVGVFGDPSLLVELAVAAEDAGWDGVFVWDHLLFREDGWPVANPTVVAAAIAARTTRIRFGVLVNAVARRHPGELAAETASLDALSGGRLVVGAGLGSFPAEWTAFGHDADPRRRADRLDEGLAAVTALWSGEPTSFEGDHLLVDAVRMPLTPLQQPRPPIWCGGTWPAKRPFRRAARWDGVMPTHRDYGLGETMPAEELAAVVAYVSAHRNHASGPFDVVLEGRTEPGEGADRIGPYIDAGLTWWIEAMGWWRGGPDAAAKRIEAGPPA